MAKAKKKDEAKNDTLKVKDKVYSVKVGDRIISIKAANAAEAAQKAKGDK